ncbi:MAG: UDP-N-acetylmuramoyl-tripeptide--D-alanyl-D-alanine ligase [Acidobacteriaceae bacterium]|nr:UDP-N-acetylmuramoyl-tripeptide--D-alanyl-D-alanine ligase [Acidobacteriaceae bacterium]
MKLTLSQIACWIHAAGDFDATAEAQGYSIDSRSVRRGELFFAVKGERLDGHGFVQAALANGALAAVVSADWAAPAEVDAAKFMRVDGCVLSALQSLAREVRRDWGGRVIGVTGSAGKTTTKEAIAQVFAARFRVLRSEGNLNNAFGLPLQLLKLEREHEAAVIEMGMNHAGEIAVLAKIAEPDWAVVSNVAPVHMEFFSDGLAGIARAKYELVEALPPDGVAVLNFDDPYVKDFGRGIGDRAVYFGLSDGADVRATDVVEKGADGIEFIVEAMGQRATVCLKLLGRHNVSNALAAIAVGLRSGMRLDECASAIGEMRATDKRGQILAWRGATIINDSYNSNPRALDAMVDALMAMPGERHLVVAGEMLELGTEAEALHLACGHRMGERGVTEVLGVQGAAEAIVRGARERGVNAEFVSDAEAAGEWLRNNVHAGDVVLLKASRGVRLERALEGVDE